MEGLWGVAIDDTLTTDDNGSGTGPVLLPTNAVSGKHALIAWGTAGEMPDTTVTVVSQYHLLIVNQNYGIQNPPKWVMKAGVKLGSTYLQHDTRPGYKFAGWFTAKSGGTKVTASTKMWSTNKTIYAHWTAKKYKVSFSANGGKTAKPKSKTVTMAKKYGTLAKTSRTNFTFKGWFTLKSGGVKVTSTTKFTKAASQTLYAHWLGKSVKVTFSGNGGTPSLASKTVHYRSAYGALPTADQPGFVFLGWFTAKTGGTQITETSIVTTLKAQTLYAHWEPGPA